MSIGGSLSGITFSGLSSGIDTDTMVQRLIQLEAIPITRLQQQQAQLTSRMGVLNQFKSRLTALATAAGALNSATAFNPMQAASSAADVATITATSSAGAGTYALKVSKLAQAQKVASEAQVGTTVALGQAGTFVLNGKAISVEASDTLTNIAQKINGAGAGVTASVINGGDNNAYLTISASRTGAANSIQMADATGSVLASLGVLSGSVQARLPITGGFAGYGLSSSTASAASAMGASALPSGTITVNGVGIAIDLNADSLQDISNRINTSGSGATASVASIVKDGVTTHRLEITGVTQPTLIDDQNILQTLGIYQQAAGSEILVAQDATYSLDDIPLTSETNTITSVIPGATITLLRADETSPPASTLTLSRDDADIVKKVKAFMDAYNATVDFIKTNSSFNKDTFQSGPLFGESSVRQVESELSTILFNTVHSGGAFTNLTQVGFDFDESGKLTLDEAKLTQALSTDPNSVSTLFRAVGVGSNNTLQYISSTNRSRPGATPYDIEITQVATRGSYLAATAQTSANPGNETLTFSGSLFGSSSYQLVLEVGSTLA
ncbi:MAG TPA: flagellar filament capping protein FliD, partial [Fimbriimonadaceae bacterium]|nr:flagellar filament capping protein FliD [Fimbriimonadaceae bacterium]